MKGVPRLKSNGFTIIEILIVLTVTGALFVSAITMMAGRQRQAEFNTAIRDVQSQLQQTISEVGNGFYPSQNNFNCAGQTTGPDLSTGTSTVQGSNKGCIFMGKVVQFGVKPATGAEQYPIFSVVGLRQVDGNGPEVTTLADAKPTVIAPSTSRFINMPNVTDIKKMPGGLIVKWARIDGIQSVPTNVGAVAFLSSLAPVSGGVAHATSAQHVSAVPVSLTSLAPTSLAEAAERINVNLKSSKALSAADTGAAAAVDHDLRICINSGGTDQSGLITIGGKGRNLSVQLQIQGGPCSA